jgi:hypothetical protein
VSSNITNTGPIAACTARRYGRPPSRSLNQADSNSLTSFDVIGSAAFSMSTNVPHDLHGRNNRHPQGRRMLIVLDDAAGPDQVRPLLPGSAGCAVIVTSRRGLPEDMGRAITLEPMEHSDGLEFFARLVGRARVQAEPEAADQVVAACGGIPLAIRIAGRRLTDRLR